MTNDRPVMMSDLEHIETKLSRKFQEERKSDMKEIMDLLRPIADTYKTASTLGKWAVATAVFISIILGIVLSLRSLIKH